jgi:hypothetical protein
MSIVVAPRAVLVIAAGEQAIVVTVDGDVPCDLELVNRLLWLRLVVRRRGWSLHVERTDDDLAELLELIGLASMLTG